MAPSGQRVTRAGIKKAQEKAAAKKSKVTYVWRQVLKPVPLAPHVIALQWARVPKDKAGNAGDTIDMTNSTKMDGGSAVADAEKGKKKKESVWPRTRPIGGRIPDGYEQSILSIPNIIYGDADIENPVNVQGGVRYEGIN